MDEAARAQARMICSPKAGPELLNVLIIGCGNIAGGFDATGGDLILTHAGAYRRHGRFHLAACVEPDAAKREAFRMRWGVQDAFAELSQALGSGSRYDVVSICSPTTQHGDHLRMVLEARPRLVFCEKPITTDLDMASDLVAAYHAVGVPLAINHTRRWDPQVVQFKSALQSGDWGAVRSVVGHYNKGILNNGSHMVDLLRYLLGPLRLLAAGDARIDYSAEDPTVPALLSSSQDVPIHLVGGAASDYAFFEAQFVTEKGVVAIEQGGFSWRQRIVKPSPHFPGYRVVGDDAMLRGRYGEAMLCAAANLYDAVTTGTVLASTGESALAAQSLCNEIRLRARR